MSKKVIAILPRNEVKIFYVGPNENYLSLDGFGSGGHVHMGMPIEEYVLDGNTYNIARCHSNISDEVIEKAIKEN
ncbi:hypothetical protein [Mixta calida]|uniref:hypothetical protein n=1 Tax=Mixta calida TaxID=665913 RepID=UPI002FDCC9AE